MLIDFGEEYDFWLKIDEKPFYKTMRDELTSKYAKDYISNKTYQLLENESKILCISNANKMLLNVNEILSIKTYCDCSDLCTFFRKMYWKNIKTSS